MTSLNEMVHPSAGLAAPIPNIREYEELDGGAGKDIYFRPERLRSEDLSPLSIELTVGSAQHAVPGRLVNVSETGASFEIAAGSGSGLGAGATVHLVIRTGTDHFYEGSARVEWQNASKERSIVGVSLLDGQVDVGEMLQLRELQTHRQATDKLAQRSWRNVGHDAFKATAAEFALFLEDASEDLLRLERAQLTHGDGNVTSSRAFARWMTEDFVPGVVAYAGKLDAALADVSSSDREALRMFSNRYLQKFLLQAPWMARACNKPLGYAGDFEVMNFVYAKDLVGQTLFGKALHRAFLEVPAAEAVRARKDLIKEQLLEKLRETASKGKTRILSVAAGPAQELYELLIENTFEQQIEIVLFDQEPGALAHAHRRLTAAQSAPTKNRIKVTYLRDSIKRLLVDANIFADHGTFDAIVCSGFFDYLRVNSAIRATKTFVRYLEPGGAALIGNMVPENPSRWLMEHHLDWKLIYRSHEEMIAFARAGAPACDVRIVEERTKINPFLSITAPR